MAAHTPGFQVACATLCTLLLFPPTASPQAVTTPAWTLETDQPIEWLRFLPAHLLVVSSDDGLRGLDPADGSVRWRRDDLGNVSQVAFEAAQQVTPLPGGPPAPLHTGPLVLRLMEELPGGRLAAILADSGGARTWFDVIDLGTGNTVWSSTSLGIGEARGFLDFPDSSTILVYGSVIEPGRNRRLWARVEAATGTVLWVRDSLLLATPAQFDAGGLSASRGTINGNQPLVSLADSSLLLYASDDGLVRFDGGTGQVRWRLAVAKDLAPIGQGNAPVIASGDTAYLPTGRSVGAIELTRGRQLWISESFATHPAQMAVTSGGLLVRGVPDLRAGEDPKLWRPFAALLDTHTGKPRWKKTFGRGSGLTPFLISGDTVLMASDEGLIRLSLSQATDATLVAEKLPGRPASSLEARDGGVLIGAAQSLTLIAPDGSRRFQKEFPAPTLGLGGRLLRLALGAVAVAGGAYYSGGYLTGAAFAKYQFSTSRFAADYTYFVLKDFEGRGPCLGKIDKATGEIAAAVPLAGDKTPEYAIDAYSGLLLIKKDRALMAYQW